MRLAAGLLMLADERELAALRLRFDALETGVLQLEARLAHVEEGMLGYQRVTTARIEQLEEVMRGRVDLLDARWERLVPRGGAEANGDEPEGFGRQLGHLLRAVTRSTEEMLGILHLLKADADGLEERVAKLEATALRLVPRDDEPLR